MIRLESRYICSVEHSHCSKHKPYGKIYRLFTINSLFFIKILIMLLYLSAFCKMHCVKFVPSVSRFAANKYAVIIIVRVIAMAAQHCMLLVP